MKIVYVIEGQGACAWYRCVVPGKALISLGHHVEFHTQPPESAVATADIVVLQRPSFPLHHRIAEWLQERPAFLVTEIDDDFWRLHPSNPATRFWHRGGALDVLEACLRLSDLVTVTTPELQSTVTRFNKNVKVLPNMLPASEWPCDPKVLPDGDAVAVGWAGTATHMIDLRLLNGVVSEILERHPRVEFLFAGMPELPFRPHERIRTLPPVPIDQYAQLVSEFDIGLAPVHDSAFNRCKSDLKFVEYAMAGIPAIMSRTDTYMHTVRHGETGFLARNTKDWLKYLTRLITDPQERVRVAGGARAYAETRTIERRVGLWDEVYRDLVSV